MRPRTRGAGQTVLSQEQLGAWRGSQTPTGPATVLHNWLGSGEEFLHLSGAEGGERGAQGLSTGSGKVLHPGPRVPGTPSLRREALPRDGVCIQLFSVPPAREVKGTLSLRPVV